MSRLPDISVLDWFRRHWRDPDAERLLIGDETLPYGLSTIFTAAREKDLPVPATMGELERQLRQHLYVEGGPENLRMDAHSLRVLTNDDEYDIAYYFFDDEAFSAAPNRLAFLLRQSGPLPDAAGPRRHAYPSLPVQTVGHAGGEDGVCYLILNTDDHHPTMSGARTVAFEGVTLPHLGRHLRSLTPANGDDWPPELLGLRALTAPDEDDIRTALTRCAHELETGPSRVYDWRDLPQGHAQAHRAAMMQMLALEPEDFEDDEEYEEDDEYDPLPDVEPWRAVVGEHVAQLVGEAEGDGYQQWYLFDSLWVARHPELTESMMRFALHWDPLS